MTRRNDVTGKIFGQLTALEYVGKYQRDNILRCKCTCGNECEKRQSQLISGNSISCGCAKAKSALENSKKRGNISGKSNPNYRHGRAGTKLFQVWKGMRDRCYNQNCTGYKNYGGRGIQICEEWENDGAAFCEWAETHGYQEGLSIDRINNDGNYGPDNCRWADRHTQNINRRPFTQPKQNIAIRCIETDEVYGSLKGASLATGARVSSISRCLHGKLKHAGGYSWQKEEVNNEQCDHYSRTSCLLAGRLF